MRVQVFAQLQSLDQQLAQRSRQRDALMGEFGARDALRDTQQQRDALISRLKLERAHSSDLRWDLSELELRLHSLQEQEGDGPSDPLVARELTMLRERRDQLEDQVLRQLEQIAGLEQSQAELEQKLTAQIEQWSAREPALQAQLDQLGHAIETLQAERQALAARLPAGAAQLYDDLQRRHRGTALAPIRNRQCSACHARLPAAVFDMLTDPDALVRCPRCGRVLHVESTEA